MGINRYGLRDRRHPLIVHGASVVEWVQAQLGVSFNEKAQGMGVSKDGQICGGVVFHEWRPRYRSIQASMAGFGHWLTPLALSRFFYYPFRQLGCRSLYVCTEKTNMRARDFIERLGFKPAGLLRQGFGSVDMMLYDMLSEECKWIRSSHERQPLRAACA